MASQSEPPLDEVQWRAPHLVQQLGGIFTNTVLPYFYESPFFDPTSNNGVITNMAMRNPSMFPIIQTRQAFEEYLSGMYGIEYIVTHDPSQNDRIPWDQHSGVWVIKKQRRELVKEQIGQGEDAQIFERLVVEPLSMYFVVNENVYMAPTVGSILGSRLLSISTAMTKLYASASSLPIYNPALGRIYAAPVAKPLTATGTSAANTRQNSKEPSPLPDTATAHLASSGNLTQSTQETDANPAPTDEEDPSDQYAAALLAETFSNSLRYGKQYMDEQPLIGEPGSFIVQKSKDLQVPLGKEAASDKRATGPTSQLPPIKTDLKNEVEKKVNGGDSKGQTSPTSAAPGTAGVGAEKSPLSPTGVMKKRKKSKVQTPRTPRTPR